jgi:hypothetical protein
MIPWVKGCDCGHPFATSDARLHCSVHGDIATRMSRTTPERRTGLKVSERISRATSAGRTEVDVTKLLLTPRVRDAYDVLKRCAERGEVREERKKGRAK